MRVTFNFGGTPAELAYAWDAIQEQLGSLPKPHTFEGSVGEVKVNAGSLVAAINAAIRPHWLARKIYEARAEAERLELQLRQLENDGSR